MAHIIAPFKANPLDYAHNHTLSVKLGIHIPPSPNPIINNGLIKLSTIVEADNPPIPSPDQLL